MTSRATMQRPVCPSAQRERRVFIGSKRNLLDASAWTLVHLISASVHRALPSGGARRQDNYRVAGRWGRVAGGSIAFIVRRPPSFTRAASTTPLAHRIDTVMTYYRSPDDALSLSRWVRIGASKPHNDIVNARVFRARVMQCNAMRCMLDVQLSTLRAQSGRCAALVCVERRSKIGSHAHRKFEMPTE